MSRILNKSVEQRPLRATVIKDGGSIGTDAKTGELNEAYFYHFFEAFAEILNQRHDKIGLVIGGGPKVRELQNQAKNLDPAAVDQLAKSLMLDNAEKLRRIAGSKQLRVVATVPKNEDEAAAFAHDPTHNTVAASYFKERQSSDTVAVSLLEQFLRVLGQTTDRANIEPLVVILSNVPFIYEADPKLDPSAKPISFASLSELVNYKILSDKKENFKSGMNVPIDPVAVGRFLDLEKQGYQPTIYYTDGKEDNFRSIREILQGRKFDPRRPRQGTRLRAAANGSIHYFKDRNIARKPRVR